MFAVNCYEQDCTDGISNDGDPYVDCDDHNCDEYWRGQAVEDQWSGLPVTSICWDGIDNDCDGLVDCEEPDCMCD